MTPADKLRAMVLYVREWVKENPVLARYALVAMSGVAAKIGVRLDDEWVLAVVGAVAAWAAQSTKKKVTPVHKAARAVREERERHTAVVTENVMGSTSVAPRRATGRVSRVGPRTSATTRRPTS